MLAWHEELLFTIFKSRGNKRKRSRFLEEKMFERSDGSSCLVKREIAKFIKKRNEIEDLLTKEKN